MKKKLSVKVMFSLILSAVLFCMPIGAFVANGSNTMSAHAEESAEEVTEEVAEDTTEDVAGENTDTPEEGMEDTTVSGNDVPTPECTCDDKCHYYSVDRECEVCSEDYTL